MVMSNPFRLVAVDVANVNIVGSDTIVVNDYILSILVA
jgi:hypothetical protein